ncbi:hypothetical protein HK104_004243 [Borealophlyctis nickersoniae]|nr:hypothetical protein HK104_004243 [Borealophlyctis nickersoniae]
MFLTLYEFSLQHFCGYKGMLPYWDWSFDSQRPEGSAIWHERYLGGNGDPATGCIGSGNFSGVWATFPTRHCLNRAWTPGTGIGAQYSPVELEYIVDQPNYNLFRRALEDHPHNMIHTSVGGDETGDMFAPMTSSNDPAFWLHHANIDRWWARWQWLHPEIAWTYSGNRVPGSDVSDAQLTDSLPFFGLFRDVTVSEAMNTAGGVDGFMCFVYSNSIASPTITDARLLVVAPQLPEDTGTGGGRGGGAGGGAPAGGGPAGAPAGGDVFASGGGPPGGGGPFGGPVDGGGGFIFGGGGGGFADGGVGLPGDGGLGLFGGDGFAGGGGLDGGFGGGGLDGDFGGGGLFGGDPIFGGGLLGVKGFAATESKKQTDGRGSPNNPVTPGPYDRKDLYNIRYHNRIPDSFFRLVHYSDKQVAAIREEERHMNRFVDYVNSRFVSRCALIHTQKQEYVPIKAEKAEARAKLDRLLIDGAKPILGGLKHPVYPGQQQTLGKDCALDQDRVTQELNTGMSLPQRTLTSRLKMSDPKPAALITETERFVQEHIKNQDPSHDWHHINRVRNLALTLARKQVELNGDIVDLRLVEISALLHDIDDFKVWGFPRHFRHLGDASRTAIISTFLASQKCGKVFINAVNDIVSSISYRKELSQPHQELPTIIEAALVQDADKLDAIGAIGIARCFAFSGARNRPLHDRSRPPMLNMTKEQYDEQTAKGGGTALNHFHEKLFHLKTRMKTVAGRSIAEERDTYMRGFVERFEKEWAGFA